MPSEIQASFDKLNQIIKADNHSEPQIQEELAELIQLLVRRIATAAKVDDAAEVKLILQHLAAVKDVEMVPDAENNPLIIATRQQHVEVLSILLQPESLQILKRLQGIDVNSEFCLENPLGLACHHKNRMLRNMLLRAGADVNVSYLKQPIVYLALEQNDLETAERLIQKGADPNSCHNNKSVFYLALEKQCSSLAKLLLHYKADPNSSYDNKPALYLALELKELEIAELLILMGADLDSRYDGKSVVTLAVEQNAPQIVRLLLSNGASPELYELSTATVIAISQMDLVTTELLLKKRRLLYPDYGPYRVDDGDIDNAVRTENVAMVSLLLAEECCSASTMLRHATKTKFSNEFVQFLLDKGAYLEYAELQAAAKVHDATTMELLLEKASDVNRALSLAIDLGLSSTCIQSLLRKGADVEKEALRRAAKKGDATLIKLLLEDISDIDVALGIAVAVNLPSEFIQPLLKKGAQLPDEEDLWLAAGRYDTVTMKLLLEKAEKPLPPTRLGRDPVRFNPEHIRNRILSSAIMTKYSSEFIQYLVLEKGARIVDGETLWLAGRQYDSTIVKLLVEKSRVSGSSGLVITCYLAAKPGTSKTLELLFNNGQDPNWDDYILSNRNKRNALAVALNCKQAENIRVLLEAGADPNRALWGRYLIPQDMEWFLDKMLDATLNTKMIMYLNVQYLERRHNGFGALNKKSWQAIFAKLFDKIVDEGDMHADVAELLAKLRRILKSLPTYLMGYTDLLPSAEINSIKELANAHLAYHKLTSDADSKSKRRAFLKYVMRSDRVGEYAKKLLLKLPVEALDKIAEDIGAMLNKGKQAKNSNWQIELLQSLKEKGSEKAQNLLKQYFKQKYREIAASLAKGRPDAQSELETLAQTSPQHKLYLGRYYELLARQAKNQATSDEDEVLKKKTVKPMTEDTVNTCYKDCASYAEAAFRCYQDVVLLNEGDFSAEALYELARCYDWGIGTAAQKTTALYLYYLAACRGNAASLHELHTQAIAGCQSHAVLANLYRGLFSALCSGQELNIKNDFIAESLRISVDYFVQHVLLLARQDQIYAQHKIILLTLAKSLTISQEKNDAIESALIDLPTPSAPLKDVSKSDLNVSPEQSQLTTSSGESNSDCLKRIGFKGEIPEEFCDPVISFDIMMHPVTIRDESGQPLVCDYGDYRKLPKPEHPLTCGRLLATVSPMPELQAEIKAWVDKQVRKFLLKRAETIRHPRIFHGKQAEIMHHPWVYQRLLLLLSHENEPEPNKSKVALTPREVNIHMFFARSGKAALIMGNMTRVELKRAPLTIFSQVRGKISSQGYDGSIPQITIN